VIRLLLVLASLRVVRRLAAAVIAGLGLVILHSGSHARPSRRNAVEAVDRVMRTPKHNLQP
jgi:trehalose utilization protein